MVHARNTFGLMMIFCVVMLYVLWSSTGERQVTPSPLEKGPTGDMVKAAAPTPINDTMFVCNENFEDTRKYFYTSQANEASDNLADTDLPIIYFVTPTYPRREQIAELTRLGQTLMHVPRLHWIVADDYDGCNLMLNYILNRFGIPYTHISSPMPDMYRSFATIPRGVANRRAAINWIKTNNKRTGVLYFGDDDNTFDLKLFSEIRHTKKVSMFPVGLIGLYAVSSPVIENGKVIGFFDSWPAKRRWPVDMAGFAVSLEYLARSPNATMPYKAGYEEDEFLKSIGLKTEDIEPKANNCTEIFVWHTQTKKEKPPVVRMDARIVESDKTSLGALLRELEAMGVSHTSSSAGIKAQISSQGKSKPISMWFQRR